ncbi:MAG: hypothetical protein WDM96_04605 [Lacunisphaera sp.]
MPATATPAAECARLNALIKRHPIDLCFAGIGENAHLAFNDPPADFRTKKTVPRRETRRGLPKQQFGEGWFPSLADVPARAISMSIRQIMASRSIIITAPRPPEGGRGPAFAGRPGHQPGAFVHPAGAMPTPGSTWMRRPLRCSRKLPGAPPPPAECPSPTLPVSGR